VDDGTIGTNVVGSSPHDEWTREGIKTMDGDDYRIRYDALDFAMRYANESTTPATVVSSANTYLEFLKGASPTPDGRLDYETSRLTPDYETAQRLQGR
jgi:hypothetical protein